MALLRMSPVIASSLGELPFSSVHLIRNDAARQVDAMLEAVSSGQFSIQETRRRALMVPDVGAHAISDALKAVKWYAACASVQGHRSAAACFMISRFGGCGRGRDHIGIPCCVRRSGRKRVARALMEGKIRGSRASRCAYHVCPLSSTRLCCLTIAWCEM
mgnify:CR=1 FL=1